MKSAVEFNSKFLTNSFQSTKPLEITLGKLFDSDLIIHILINYES